MTMKPAIKTLWVIIAATFLIGLGLAGIGAALGGNAFLSLAEGNLHFYNWRDGRAYDRHGEPVGGYVDLQSGEGTTQGPISELTVRVVSADIYVKPSNRDFVLYRIDSGTPERYAVNLSDGRSLSIVHRDLSGFNLGLPNVNIGQRDVITIEVPTQMLLSDVTLSSVSGDIKITEDLTAKKLSIENVSGDVSIAGLGISDLTAAQTLIDLAPTGEEPGADTGPSFPTGTELSISSVSGNINIDQSFLSALSLDLVSGDANIAIHQMEDFTVNLNSVGGRVELDDGRVISGLGVTSSGAGPKRADINMVSGTVRLEDMTITP
ncbi:MAG: DUF4097 domain-containing protein [Coriobacteriia bacterium]|nr:DUF4097 domain-containing protein [Coriobacteriia bacterium]MCL2537313.1 DUF4097 domain-containing protein [Coriobacteriia bacterium]